MIKEVTMEDLEDTLNYLEELRASDIQQFYKAYRTIPFNMFSEIERIATSKSTLYKDLCIKAKDISDSFHKSIK